MAPGTLMHHSGGRAQSEGGKGLRQAGPIDAAVKLFVVRRPPLCFRLQQGRHVCISPTSVWLDVLFAKYVLARKLPMSCGIPRMADMISRSLGRPRPSRTPLPEICLRDCDAPRPLLHELGTNLHRRWGAHNEGRIHLAHSPKRRSSCLHYRVPCHSTLSPTSPFRRAEARPGSGPAGPAPGQARRIPAVGRERGRARTLVRSCIGHAECVRGSCVVGRRS